MRFLESRSVQAGPPFAPPFLKAGKQVIAQTANILLFLGPRLRLAPRDEAARLWAHQLQLTIADWSPKSTTRIIRSQAALLRGPKTRGEAACGDFIRSTPAEVSRLFRADAGAQRPGARHWSAGG